MPVLAAQFRLPVFRTLVLSVACTGSLLFPVSQGPSQPVPGCRSSQGRKKRAGRKKSSSGLATCVACTDTTTRWAASLPPVDEETSFRALCPLPKVTNGHG